MVVTALMQNGKEMKMARTLQRLQAFLPPTEMRTLLMMENNQGLRPVEHAAHVGAFLMFSVIIQTKGI